MIEKFNTDRLAASKWAKAVLADGSAIILDTETTGLYGEPVEVSVINVSGETLIDTLVKPTLEIEPGAYGVHGLGEKELQDAPGFPDVYPALCRVLASATQIVIYNADFDHRILENARRLYKLAPYPVADYDVHYLDPDTDKLPWRGLTCAMRQYAKWYGEWNDYHGNYKWQPLNGGHRALDDCKATLARIKEMAN